ncbi:MAG: hypothetical protein NTU98_15020 [Bacteroidetes bacterium]|nr:hypothetical protein [Bacteroidota bacterium]
MQTFFRSFITILLLLTGTPFLPAQSWKFIKEKDGIRLYTKLEKGGPFKSFRGETDISADIEKVSALIGNPVNSDWWGDDVSDISVLLFKKNRNIRYYFIYHVPWPFTDRDLVANVEINEDPATSARTVFSTPLPGVIPEKKGLIRVTDFWQKWTIQPLSNGMIHLVLEGYINPAGSVPAWLYNIVVIDTPLRLLHEVERRAGEK